MVSLKNGKKSRLARNCPFSQILSHMYISAVRPSFRIYLSSISTIYNISSVTRMCIRHRGHRCGSEHFDAMLRKRASFVTSRDTEKER